MLLRKSCGGSDEARLRMRDELDRHLVHSALEAAFGDESVVKAGARQRSGQSKPDPAGNHDCTSALCERNVAGNRSQSQADAVEGGIGEAVASLDRRGPQRFLIVEDQLLPFDRAERLVDVPQAATRSDPLDGYPPEAPPQFDQDTVFEDVERSEVDVAAFGLDHFIAAGLL